MVERKLTWKDLPKGTSGKFEPKPYYDPNDDSITFYFCDDESYRERVDDFLTVYRSCKTEEVVGCHLKNISKILDTVRALKIGLVSKDWTMGLLVLGAPWATDKLLHFQERKYREEVYNPVMRALAGTPFPELQDA